MSGWFEESFRAREQMRTIRAELRQQARELELDRIRREAFATVRDRLQRDTDEAEYQEAERHRLYRGTHSTASAGHSHDLDHDRGHSLDYDDQ